MSDKAYVTNLSISTNEDGIDVEVIITRTWRHIIQTPPRVDDVPADVRRALWLWLGSTGEFDVVNVVEPGAAPEAGS